MLLADLLGRGRVPDPGGRGLRVGRRALARRAGAARVHRPSAAGRGVPHQPDRDARQPRAGGDHGRSARRGRPRARAPAALARGDRASRRHQRVEPAAQGAAGLPALRRRGGRRARLAGRLPERPRHRRHVARARGSCSSRRRAPGRSRPCSAWRSSLTIAFCIVILGWHFPSDVVGGFLLATGWALVIAAGLRSANERWPEHAGRTRATAALQRGRRRDRHVRDGRAGAACWS